MKPILNKTFCNKCGMSFHILDGTGARSKAPKESCGLCGRKMRSWVTPKNGPVSTGMDQEDYERWNKQTETIRLPAWSSMDSLTER